VTKVKATVAHFNATLDGELIIEHEQSNNSLVTRTTLIIPKTNHSVEILMGWPFNQNIEFLCEPGGYYDFNLLEETATHYVFA
jgi:hypothetical protein